VRKHRRKHRFIAADHHFRISRTRQQLPEFAQTRHTTSPGALHTKTVRRLEQLFKSRGATRHLRLPCRPFTVLFPDDRKAGDDLAYVPRGSTFLALIIICLPPFIPHQEGASRRTGEAARPAPRLVWVPTGLTIFSCLIRIQAPRVLARKQAVPAWLILTQYFSAPLPASQSPFFHFRNSLTNRSKTRESVPSSMEDSGSWMSGLTSRTPGDGFVFFRSAMSALPLIFLAASC